MEKDKLRKFIDIIACPKCKGELILKYEGFICPTCKLIYPIVDNIPILLIEKAKPTDNDK